MSNCVLTWVKNPDVSHNKCSRGPQIHNSCSKRVFTKFDREGTSWLEPWLRSRNRKESEVFGWSRIFCPTLTPGAQLDHFVHHTPKLGIPVEMVQFLLKLLLKQRFLAVYHDFH